MKKYLHHSIIVVAILFLSTSVIANAMLSCATGTMVLTITLDNATTETNWELKDANHTVYASGYAGYGNQLPGTVITEVLPSIPDGDYALVFFDAGGNGICCNNGNGSYELRDGNNTLITSGTSFVFSEISTFCYNSTNNDVFDLTAPSTVVLSVGNVTNNWADLNWTTATDNDAIFGYGIMVDGVYAGWTTYTSATVPLVQTCTAYNYEILVRDLIGNFSVFSNMVTVNSPCPPTTTVVHEGYFESGWDGWTDGGSDCARYSGSRSAEGSYSIRIRDNSGNKSSMTSPVMDLSSYNSVTVDFQYYHHGYENGEDFFLKLLENGSWTTVATFERGVDFTSNGLYSGSISLDANTYNLSTNSRLKFQSDASNNNDKIYIDAVVVTGISNNASLVAPEAQPMSMNMPLIKEFRPDIGPYYRSDLSKELDVEIFPNPTFGDLQLNGILNDQIKKIEVYGVDGKIIKTMHDPSDLTISELESGIYLIKINLIDNSEILKRCIKK